MSNSFSEGLIFLIMFLCVSGSEPDWWRIAGCFLARWGSLKLWEARSGYLNAPALLPQSDDRCVSSCGCALLGAANTRKMYWEYLRVIKYFHVVYPILYTFFFKNNISFFCKTRFKHVCTVKLLFHVKKIKKKLMSSKNYRFFYCSVMYTLECL